MPETKNHQFTLSNRENLVATGVEKINFFSPEAVVAQTSKGKIIIKGKNLYVENLDSQKGELNMRGIVKEIIYEDGYTKENFFKKIFK